MINNPAFEKILFYLALAILLTGSLLRAIFLDFSDFDYGVYSDHFINAVTAKNIAGGLGWSSSGYETYLLNPENLTIGPTLVLPVALAIALFGNALVVPGLTVLLINLFCLALVLRALKKLHSQHVSFYLCAFLFVFVFVFFKSYYWYRMIGEVSATLLLLLVVIYLSDYLQTFRLPSLFAASLAGAFAMGTKELVLLPIIVLTVVVFVVSFFSAERQGRGWQFWLGRPLLFLGASLLLPLLFFFYQQTVLHSQPGAWRTAYFTYAKAIHDYYSGINTLHEYLSSPTQLMIVSQRVLKSTLWNGSTLLHLSFAGMRGLHYWLAVFAFVVACILVSRKLTAPHALLALSATPLLLWFFCISEKAMPRHLYIALLLAVLASLLYIASLKNSILRYVLAGLVLLLIVFTGDQSSRVALASWPLKASGHFSAIKDMQAYIETQPHKSLAWLGMIDNNEFEFLSPTPDNFVSGFDLIADAIVLDEPAYLAAHPELPALIDKGLYRSALDFYTSPENSRVEAVRVSFVKPLSFNWLHFKSSIARHHRTGFQLERGELCATLVYQNDYYVVERCSREDIQAFLDGSGGLAFRPRKWRPYILLPSERAELF